MANIIFDGGNAAGPGNQALQLTNDTVQGIIDLVTAQLGDPGNIRWGVTAKLLPYLNRGIKELINMKPEAFTAIIVTPLAGGARQALPPGAIFLVDVECTTDLSGNPASNVTLVDRLLMDKMFPGWLTYAGGDLIQYVIKDQRNPFYFYVFPAPPAGTTQSAALICTVYPQEITDPTEIFPLDNNYIAAIVNYIVYRCLGEETTVPGAIQKSQAYLQSFMQAIGVTIASKAKSDAQDV